MGKRGKQHPAGDRSEEETLREARQPAAGTTARSLASILLFIHLAVVVTCLWSNLAPSPLQLRILRLFRPYARLANLELDGTRFELTQAGIDDVEHHIEFRPPDEAVTGSSVGREDRSKGSDASPLDGWQPLARGMRGGERRHRYERFSAMLAYFVSREDEEGAALIVQAAARTRIKRDGVAVKQVRARRQLLQSWDVVTDGTVEQRDPYDASYYRQVYLADVIVSGPHRIDLVKRTEAALEAAPDQKADGTQRQRRRGS